MYDTIFQHRSIRKYKSDPIPDDILDRVLEAGSRASTTGNMQVYSMVVTKDEEIRKQLDEEGKEKLNSTDPDAVFMKTTAGMKTDSENKKNN